MESALEYRPKRKIEPMHVAIAALAIISALILGYYFLAGQTGEVATETIEEQEEIPQEEPEEEIAFTECPYECCNQGEGYRVKICFQNRECIANECELRECTFECCEGRTGFEDKACPNDLACVKGMCEKEECPARCCPPRDPLYEEKECPSHSVCVGRVCVPRV